jgi:hypothetical protein
MAGASTFTSSSRFHDVPGLRASSAFDADPGTAWMGIWVTGAPRPWLAWRSARVLVVDRLRLAPVEAAVRRPAVVRLTWPGGATGPLPVGAGGLVALPRPVRARSFRLTVLATRLPARGRARAAARRAVGISRLTVPGLVPAVIPRRGHLHARCGGAQVVVGGRTVSLRPVGTVAALDAGRPLRLRGCGAPTPMARGIHEVRARPGPLAVDLLRLRSPAPRPAAFIGGGRVVDSGHPGRSRWTGVRVALRGPSWVVLGESFSHGWEAKCDGRSLGPSHVVDGYANGWPAPAGCRRVDFVFGPQRASEWSYGISALTCLLLVALLLVGRRRRPAAIPHPARLPAAAGVRLAPVRALLVAAVAAVVIGFIFSLRAGAVAGPLLAVLLWRGVSPRGLTAAAAALLGLVVPAVYLLDFPLDVGGFNSDYAVAVRWAHWAGVAAVVLLGLAAWRSLRAADPAPAVAQPSAGSSAKTTARAE